jgi:hypothetical protein
MQPKGMKLAKKKIPDLHIEFASDSGNYFYLTVLEYRRENYLVIVDNITEDAVGAYVLDFAQQEGVDMKSLISIITRWFYSASCRYPLSFEFSRLGIAPMTNRIYRNFELAHVTRLIGNGFKYDLFSAPKVRRRRVSLIPAGVEIKLKRTV